MIIKELIELTEDSGRSSEKAVMGIRREHVEGRRYFFLYKTGRLLGNDVIKMIMLMHHIQDFLVSTQMSISQ